MYDVRCLLSDVWYKQMSLDVWCLIYIWCLMSDVWCKQMSDIWLPIYIWCLILCIRCLMTHYRCLIIDVRYLVCKMCQEVRCQTSDVWYMYDVCCQQMSDVWFPKYVWCLILYIRRQMTDYRCIIIDVRRLMCKIGQMSVVRC